MKILHIGKYYPPYLGGMEKVTFDLVKGLNEKGIQTDVLCFNTKNQTQIEQKKYKIIRAAVFVTLFSTPFSLAIYKQLKKIHKEYDLIHLRLPNPTATLALQMLGYKSKLVLHWHLDIVKQKLLKVFYKPFQNSLLKSADAIIVTSQTYLDHSRDLEKHVHKCVVIPIGINQDHLRENPAFREKLENQYVGKKLVFSMGRLIYYKGFEYLIEAAKYLNEGYKIVIGGKGPLEKKLRETIDSNNLGKKVELIGKIPQEELWEYYRRADVFCLPSVQRSEAFGIVLVEAMSAGCPLVTTKIGSGTSWINQEGVTGFAVSPRNPKKLAEAIENIAGNEELTTAFSKNAIQRYNTEFRLPFMIDRTVDLYKKLLKKDFHKFANSGKNTNNTTQSFFGSKSH